MKASDSEHPVVVTQGNDSPPKPTIIRYLARRIGLLVALCVGILVSIESTYEFYRYTVDAETIRERAKRETRDRLATFVLHVCRKIDLDRASILEDAKNEARTRMGKAHWELHGLLKKSGELDREEKESLATRWLDSVWYDNGKGYIFAIDDNQILRVYPPDPTLEGRVATEVFDATETVAVRKMLATAHDEGAGFVRYVWQKPFSGGDRDEKIAFVTYVDDLNWMLGTGVYLGDIERAVMNRVLSDLEGTNPNGIDTLFVVDGDGKVLFQSVDPENGTSIPIGDTFLDEAIAIGRDGGGFLHRPPVQVEGQSAAGPVTFVAGIPEWNWYVGAGSSHSDLEARLESASAEHIEQIKEFGFAIILSALLIFVVTSLGIRQAVGQMRTSVERLDTFFRNTAEGSSRELKPESMEFQEFHRLAQQAQRMVNARKQAESELVLAAAEANEANAAKSRFLANMSHELRTPLNSILGFSEIIRERMFGSLSDRYADYARMINDSGNHLLQLINDVLDLSRIDAGKFELHEETVDVPAQVASAIAMVAENARQKGIEIVEQVPETVPGLFADQLRVNQILLNLLSNAIKYSESGEIRVTLTVDDAAGMVIDVSDDGIGMSDQDIDVALSPFGRVESDYLNRRHEGAGLGIPITKQLAEMHGGGLGIVSVPGQGTTISVRFPAERIVSDKTLVPELVAPATDR